MVRTASLCGLMGYTALAGIVAFLTPGCGPNDSAVDFDQADPRVLQELDALEGQWEVVAGGDPTDGRVQQLVIDRVGVSITGRGPFGRYLISVDPTRQPKWMDLDQYAPYDPTIYGLPKNWTPEELFAVYAIKEDGTLCIRYSLREGYRPQSLTGDEPYETWYAELRRAPDLDSRL